MLVVEQRVFAWFLAEDELEHNLQVFFDFLRQLCLVVDLADYALELYADVIDFAVVLMSDVSDFFFGL